MITLSDEQLNAINEVKEFLNSNEIAFSITGAAGTGKTSIMMHLYNELKDALPICFCAPTHKAKLVLQKATSQKAITLHSLLALTPQLDIFELDFKDLLFKSDPIKDEIPYNGLVICDEASMINDDLYKVLIEKCQQRKTKILFVSDQSQLMPVKSDNVSLVYQLPNNFNLTKIFRQTDNNPLHPYLNILRNNSINHFQTTKGEEGVLLCTNDSNKFLNLYIKQLQIAIKNSDILLTKLTAYTNERVNQYNKIIKQVLFNKQEYNQFEFLTGCENIEFNNFKFYNSMDYIICSEPKKKEIIIPYFGVLPGWDIELYDSVDNISANISILSKEISKDYFESLAYCIEDLRISAIKDKSRSRCKKWAMYYKIIGSFATPIDLTYDGRIIKKQTFTEGYASTVHKLQGSTYDNIFIDMKNINKCVDDKIHRQLQYVALSRTRKNAIILQ